MKKRLRPFSAIMGVFFLFFLYSNWNSAAQTESITFTNRQGQVFENVSVIKIDDNGLQYRYNQGAGGGSIRLGALPDDLLVKFGYDPTQVAIREREKADQEANRLLEKAISGGQFREVDGVVYDLRKNQPGWVIFQNVKLLQRLESGAALVDPTPGNNYSSAVLHVKHLPAISDTELFSFRAKPVGTYDYINKLDNSRSVRSYDAGRVCRRDEIPEPLLKGTVPSARISAATVSLNEILPASEADSLVATGTGFFITDDGYLVTNNHVVNGAKKLRIRMGSKTLDAHVVKTSRAFDLAIVKVEGVFESLPLEFESQMGLGDSVFTIGYPNVDVQGAAPKYTDGKISSLSGMEDDPSQYQISVPVQPGNSGGPLIAENGGVVGIVRAKMNDLASMAASGSVPQNVNYAVKAKYLKDLLETVPGIMSKIKKPAGNPKNSEAVKATQAATVIVLVY